MGCTNFDDKKREKYVGNSVQKTQFFVGLKVNIIQKSMNGSDSREFNFDRATKLKVVHQKERKIKPQISRSRLKICQIERIRITSMFNH